MNRLDRRALFASGAAAALLAATGTSVHGSPKRGGTLRLAIPRDPDLMQSLARWARFDALVEIGPDGILRGELATRWQSDGSATRWAFDLRQDAAFGGGTPVGVEDILASLSRGLDAQASVWVDGDARVVVELAQANPHLPYVLASELCVVTPGGQIADPWGTAAGSGCYGITRANEGRDFRAERREGHYKSEQAGWLDAVEVAVIPDPEIRAEALRDGFVDVAAFPADQTLRSRRDLTFHPSVDDMQLVAHHGVGVPRTIGNFSALDDGRLLERWWMI